jgi:hypothetical protein
MKTLKVRLTFTEGILGSCPNTEDIYSEFIASKAPMKAVEESEVESFDVVEEVERGTTVFIRDDDGDIALYDYTFKGFFKDTCGALKRVTTTKSSKIKAYKKIIDGLIFVEPRKIKLNLPEGEAISICQRPLRASTAQGERIALASSEEAPAGTTCEFEITLIDESLEPLILEWLDMGKYRGHGQWRNSGKGKFTYEVLSA